MEKKNLNVKILNFYNLYRFQFTIVTCRTTVYILFFFWLFFFFFGETLILFIFNFSSISDVIPGNYFFTFKNFTVFSVNTLSFNLSNVINFYIFFFTASALIFLINLNYTTKYFYSSFTFKLDFFFLLLLFYFFTPKLFFIFIFIKIFNFFIN